jgi:hypothetical protein
MKRAWAKPTKGDANAFCEFHTYDLIFNNLKMIFTYEIPMSQLSLQPNPPAGGWVSHATVKKQII